MDEKVKKERPKRRWFRKSTSESDRGWFLEALAGLGEVIALILKD